MATTGTYTPNQLYSVPLAELQSDPNQPRKYLDPQALEELTASVVQHGILEPILFRQDKQTGLLYVVAGERRCAEHPHNRPDTEAGLIEENFQVLGLYMNNV